MMENIPTPINSTISENTKLNQELTALSRNGKQQINVPVIVGGLIVIGIVLLTVIFFIYRNLFEYTEIETNPTILTVDNSVSPPADAQDITLQDWNNYSLGDYTFKLPKTLIQQTESTSPISTLFYSSTIPNLKFQMVLEGAGFGIECVDKIQTDEISLFGKRVPIETYRGTKLGSTEMCSEDSSGTFWFLARINSDDIAAMKFQESEIMFDEGKLLFDQIIATFEARKDEGGVVSETKWTTFSNAYVSFRYPTDMTLIEREANEVVLQKWGPTQKADTEFYDGISISFQPFEVPLTAEEYAKIQIEEVTRDGVGEISDPLKPIQVGAYSGVTFSATGLGNHRTIVLKSPNDMIILITDSTNDPGQLGYSRVVDQILTTVVLK